MPVIPAEAAAIVADLFELPAEALARGRLLEERGLDREGTVRFALCALDDTTRARVHALAALDPADEVAVRRILGSGATGLVSARLALPVGDADRLLAYLRTSLGRSALHPSGAAGGYDDTYVSDDGSLAVGLARAEGTLGIELVAAPIVPHDAASPPAPMSRAIAALLAHGRPGMPPRAIATEGDVARASVAPGELAELNFLLGLGRVLEALAGVDPEVRPQLLDAGFHEASQSLVVAGDAEGPHFDELVFRLAPSGTLELRASASSDERLPSEATFHPARALAVERTGTLFAVAPRFVLDFPMPGGDRFSEGPGAADGPLFHALVQAAGGMAALYTAPHLLMAELGDAMAEDAMPRSAEPVRERLARFDELAVVETTDDLRARLGLVAEGADPRAAACSYFVDPRPCLRRLREGRPLSTDGEHAVLLVRIEGRSVVIHARDAEEARRIAARVSVVAGSSPARVAITEAGLRALDVAQLLPGLCGGASGTVRREGRALVFTLAHEPCALAP